MKVIKWIGFSVMMLGLIFMFIRMGHVSTYIDYHYDDDAEISHNGVSHDAMEGSERTDLYMQVMIIPSILIGGFMFVGGCVALDNDRSKESYNTDSVFSGENSYNSFNTNQGSNEKICPNCGNRNESSIHYCAHCGYSFDR